MTEPTFEEALRDLRAWSGFASFTGAVTQSETEEYDADEAKVRAAHAREVEEARTGHHFQVCDTCSSYVDSINGLKLELAEVDGLTLAYFRDVNVRRCQDAFHAAVEDWPLERWALAMIGEAGEACNAVKKILRGDGSVEELGDELADVFTYLDLLAHRAGINLQSAVIRKFNAVSAKYGSGIALKQRGEADKG